MQYPRQRWYSRALRIHIRRIRINKWNNRRSEIFGVPLIIVFGFPWVIFRATAPLHRREWNNLSICKLNCLLPSTPSFSRYINKILKKPVSIKLIESALDCSRTQMLPQVTYFRPRGHARIITGRETINHKPV